jgi:large subunit ribosomal protein L7/L12
MKIILTDIGPSKLAVLKLIIKISGLDSKSANDLIKQSKIIIKEYVCEEEAKSIQKEFEEAGGTVEIINPEIKSEFKSGVESGFDDFV